MHKLVREAKAMGNVFFGIVGGEPFMHPQLFDDPRRASRLLLPGLHQRPLHHRRDDAKQLRQLGNVTPLISVEGNEIVSDERRGRSDVLSKTMQGLQNCLEQQGLHRRLHQPVPDRTSTTC